MNLTPLIDGGAQEYGLRAGTENVVSIIALAKAAGLAISEMPTETKRLENLKNYFLEKLKIYTPDIVVNGCLDKRLPNNLNIGFKGVDGNALLLSLNQTGIYASTGSACNSGGTEVSHVIKAIGLNTEEYATIRFSFGRYTTKDDLDYTIKYVQKILEDLKK